MSLCRLCSLGALLVMVPAGAARAAPPRTWNFLTTGNGHGFQVYDVSSNRIVSFLDHPYRYTSPRPDPRSDGYSRRNLAFDMFFGVRGGGTSGWLKNGSASGEPGYLDESNIIRVPLSLSGLATESYFFSPFGFEGNAMIAMVKASGASEAFTLFNFHMGSPGDNPDNPGAEREVTRQVAGQPVVIETGPGGGAMVYVGLSGVDRVDCQGAYARVQMGQDVAQNPTCNGDDLAPAFQRKLGADGWFAVGVLFVENAADAEDAAARLRTFVGARTPEQLLTEARAEWDRWRRSIPDKVTLSADERKLWRQGEAVLRMGQVREPYSATRKNNGMVLASLPRGEWHTGWVRDAQYALVALARSGHQAEAKLGLNFFLNAEPVGKFKSYLGGVDYRISVVRYFGNGEEEADYSGQPTPNIEIDGWGMVLWAARQYVDGTGDTAWLTEPTRLGTPVYDALKRGVADALEQNLEPNGIAKPDTSVWEVHWDKRKHYAYTTLSAYRGLCDMATLALRAGKTEDVRHFQQVAQRIATGFFASFLDRQGAIGGSVEQLTTNNYADAAVVEAFTWGMLTDPRGKTGVATLDLLNRLRVESGGFKRLDGSSDTYDLNEWILIDLRMSDAMRRAGRGPEADALLASVVDKSINNFYLLPELYNAVRADGQVGKYTGSIPMVGYGGGAIILTLLDRAGLFEPGDCGASILDTDGGGVIATDGGIRPPTDPGAGPGELPRTTACICQAGGAAPPGPFGVWLVPWLVLGARLLRRRRETDKA